MPKPCTVAKSSLFYSGIAINLQHPLLQCCDRTQSIFMKLYAIPIPYTSIHICNIYIAFLSDTRIRQTFSAGSASFLRFRERWRQELSRSCPKCISVIPPKRTPCTQQAVGVCEDMIEQYLDAYRLCQNLFKGVFR